MEENSAPDIMGSGAETSPAVHSMFLLSTFYKIQTYLQ